ncbi:hypothetical protein SNE40_009308 [Patella caerulea]|uniref:RAP domain-containing protein n=2 Tax=Patella caerulea TaxID=87958 RepID=A0AAN8JTA2_PATCE
MLSKRVLSSLWWNLRFRLHLNVVPAMAMTKCKISSTSRLLGPSSQVLNDINLVFSPPVNSVPINQTEVDDIKKTQILSDYMETVKFMTIDQLLNEATNVTNIEQANIFLTVLCVKLKVHNVSSTDSIEKVLADHRLQNLFSFFDLENNNIPVYIWINTLKNLLKLNITTFDLKHRVQSHLVSVIDKLSVSDLVKLSTAYKPYKEKDFDQQQIFNRTINILEDKCANVTIKPNELISVMYLFANLNNMKGLDKIEKKLLSLVPEMKVTELYKVIFILSSCVIPQRKDALLKTVVTCLNKCEKLNLTRSQLSKLLYACGVLSIYDVQLLNKICDEIKNLHNIGPRKLNFISSIIISLGRLRWKDTELLYQCSTTLDSLQNEIHRIPDKPIVMKNILLALARLDYKRLPPLFKQQYTELTNPADKIDFVWSLVVLQNAQPRHFKDILNPAFLKHFTSLSNSTDQYKMVLSHQKLQNIDCDARKETVYNGPYLPESYSFCLPKELVGCEKQTQDLVLSALDKMAPSDRFLNTSECPGGHSVEAIMYVDDDGNPQNLNNITDKHHKICIKVQSFSDTTLKTEGPTGIMSMTIRHLEFMGYRVVIVPYTILSGKPKLLDIIRYIKTGIKEAVAKSKSTV